MNFHTLPKFCISLKGSTRRTFVSEQFKNAGITNVNFFDAVDKKDLIVPELSPKLNKGDGIENIAGILACMQSHVKLITLAKAMNIKAMVVFEDDVVFCDDFNERIEYIEKLNLDFDFFSLGGHFDKPERPFIPSDNDARKMQHENIFRIFHQGGTYAYIIKDTVYDFVIRNSSYHYGADQFYSDYMYSRFKCYAFVPFLVSCANLTSQITGTDWVYENLAWYFSKDRIIQQQKKTYLGIPCVKSVTDAPMVKNGESLVDLSDCTFITAVRIESPDREFNFLRVIQYLCDNFNTNIIIKESAKFSRVVEILPFINKKGCNIIHTFEYGDVAFHRTRLLNEALFSVNSPVVINYDIDVFMEKQAYIDARNKILNEGFDLVFPFKLGGDVQKQVTVPTHVKQNYRGESLFNPEWITPWQSYCGHVQFFNTLAYKAGGGENEYFISYGAEDREREERFRRLGYKITWGEYPVYHIEHSRGNDSSVANPHFGTNDNLLRQSREMSDAELKEYYKNIDYLKKYEKNRRKG